MYGRSLDDSGLAATPRCRRPIIVRHPDEVTRDVTCRHDNSSPSSSSSSSQESGIKSPTDGSSPEHLPPPPPSHYCQQQQQQHDDARSMTDDVPLDLSLSSLLPRQRESDDEDTGVYHRSMTSRHHDNDNRLSQLSAVDDRLPLLSNAACSVTPRDVTRCQDNGDPLPILSFVDSQSPMVNSGQWLLPPPVFSQSPRYLGVPVLPATEHTSADTSLRLPESAKLLLTSWYETHVRHPYPQPDELFQLVTMTGQSKRKILKWLANRRARTGNTLPHNGSVHPRKIVKIRQLRQLVAEEGPHHEQRATRRSRQRSSRFLPESVVDGLRRWYDDHLGYPYPTDAEKRHLAEQLGTTVVKVTNWFANKRNRSGHGRSVVSFQHDATQICADLSTLSPPSTFDWRYNVASLPRSLSTSTLVQTRQLNELGHLQHLSHAMR